MIKIYHIAIFAAAATIAFTAAVAQEEAYSADLSGTAEVPGPGDSDGAGLATLDWNDMSEQLCYAISVENIGPATAAHVHRGAEGEAGPPVLTLAAPTNGESDGCVDTPADVRRDIRANPAGFYFNVHNEEHPAGAVRGQLER